MAESADNDGSRVYVTDQSAGGAKVTFNNDNGNFGSQTSGITVSHYSTGGVFLARDGYDWSRSQIGRGLYRYGAMEANISGWAIQPVRVQA